MRVFFSCSFIKHFDIVLFAPEVVNYGKLVALYSSTYHFTFKIVLLLIAEFFSLY